MTAFDWGKWRRCSNSQSGIQAYLGWRRRGRRRRWLGPSTPAASPAYQAHTVSQQKGIKSWYIHRLEFLSLKLETLVLLLFFVSTIFHTAVLQWNAEVCRCSMLKEAWKFGTRERISKVHIHCSRYKILCICCKHSIHIRCFGVLLFIIDNFPRENLLSQVAGSFHHSSIPARNSDADHEKKPKRRYLMSPGRHLLSEWNPFKRLWFNG